MALNINFQGNVFDENGTEINCKYMAFSDNISKWGDARDTEFNQYNVNFGDGDLNTQAGSVSIGDVILVLFWRDAATKDEQLTDFAMVRFIYDSTDSVVQNIQLKPPHAPSCSFGLVSNGLVGENITATSYATSITQWNFESITHYQRKDWYGQTIFGFLDIARDEFNFNSGYSSIGSNTYNSHGDYLVLHQVENTYSLLSECQKEIRIKYRSPVGGLYFLQELPLTGDNIDIVAAIQDIDSRITAISHIFDSEVLYANTNLLHEYSVDLIEYGEYYAEQTIFWNDGFDDNILNYSKQLVMGNRPPDVSVIASSNPDTDGLFRAHTSVTDADGTIANICWKLFYEGESEGLPHPYFRCVEPESLSYNEIYTFCDVNRSSMDLLFAIPGKYKIEVTATDDLGANGVGFTEFIVTDVCDGVIAPCEECPDCPPVEDCPDCPEVPIADCSDAIELAIENYKRELESRVTIDESPKLIVVQDGRASGSASGTVGGEISGDIQVSDIIATMDNSLSGEVSGGSTSGNIGGCITGTVKK